MSLVQSLLWRKIVGQPIEHPKLDPEPDPAPAPGSDEVCRGYLGGEEEKRAGSYDERIIGSLGHHASGVIGLPRQSGSWGDMLPELLSDIMRRVEESEDKWPQRQNVVACGSVCKQWKDAMRKAVETASLRQPGLITFTSSLKKPGPYDSPAQCLIKRDRKNGTFHLYLCQSQSLTEKGKVLLAAQRHRRGVHTEYIMSMDASDLSQGSKAYIGKVRSDFIGTNFTIYDSHPPHSGAKPSSRRACRRVGSKQISPQISSRNFEVGRISYKFNLLKSRGPRRMVCSLTCPSSAEASDNKDPADQKMKELSPPSYVVLKNKAPKWYEHLQCWCLNFHGRVTVASVKNFQLVASAEDSMPGVKADGETVILQFGKVGDDTFTMDYRQPLSPFQAFAICLTSFGTKLACE